MKNEVITIPSQKSGREKATWGVWKNNPAWLIAQDELHPFPIT